MISKSKIYKKNLFGLIIFTFTLCKPTPAKTQEQSLWEDLRLDGGQINSIAINPADASVVDFNLIVGWNSQHTKVTDYSLSPPAILLIGIIKRLLISIGIKS